MTERFTGGAVQRPEDMSVKGVLRLIWQEDGDMVVKIIDEHGDTASVEFCSSMGGGGRSSKTLEALRNLFKAMKEENKGKIDPRIPNPFENFPSCPE